MTIISDCRRKWGASGMSVINTKRRRVAAILAVLKEHSQRITYGALGDYVDLPARSVMQGEPKNERNAWVVSGKSGRPTGYPDETMPAPLFSNSIIIRTAVDLGKWLEEKGEPGL